MSRSVPMPMQFHLNRGLILLLGLLAWGGAPIAGAAEETGPAPLTVSGAVEWALTHNRRLQQGGLAVEAARDRERQARSLAYPQITGSALASWLLKPLDLRFPAGSLGSYAATGPVPGRSTDVRVDPGLAATGSLQLTQPLSQQYKIAQRAEAAGLAGVAEFEKLRGRRLLVTEQVKQSCLAVLQAQSSLAMLAETRVFLVEYKRVMALGVAAASVLRPEELAVDARLAELDWQEAQARDQLAGAQEQVNFLLGRSLAEPVVIAPFSTALPEDPDLAEAMTRAVGMRPELKQARAEHEAAQRSVAASRADRLPDVSAVVAQQWFGRMDPLPRSVGYAGLAVQWDLFDGGRRRSEVAAGQRAVAQARLGLSEVEEQLRQEVAAAHRVSRQSRLALRGAELALALETERLRVVSELREADAALSRDLLQQRAAFEAARSRRQQAFFAAWLARFALERALGVE